MKKIVVLSLAVFAFVASATYVMAIVGPSTAITSVPLFENQGDASGGGSNPGNRIINPDNLQALINPDNSQFIIVPGDIPPVLVSKILNPDNSQIIENPSNNEDLIEPGA